MSLQQQQFFNLLLLLLIGMLSKHLYLLWYEVVMILSFTLVLDRWILLNLSYSSLSTAIGVMFMMVSTHLWIYFLVITLALFQKNHLSFNQQHFFNPSNFALIMALLFFYEDAHIVLGQLGDDIWVSILLFFMASFILFRANRWVIPISFVLFYLIFQYIIIVNIDPLLIMEEIYNRFYSISFLLFLLFMLTDPKTTPSQIYFQAIFAFFIALFVTALDYFYGFRVQHLFLALFFFSLFTPLIEQWHSKEKMKLLGITILLLLLVIVVIMSIENRPPYYFTMEH